MRSSTSDVGALEAGDAQGGVLSVHSLSADVSSILDTIELPVIVVGRDCTLARFNQAAANALNLTLADTGLLPSNIAALSDMKDFEKLCVQVIADGAPCRQEVRKSDRWFLLRVAPYPGSDGTIIGAVLTFTNVTAFRENIGRAIYEREHTKTILNTVIEALVVLDSELQVQTANRAFYVMFGVSRETAQGVPLRDLGDHDWKTSGLWSSLKETVCDNREFQRVEVERDFPIGRRTVLLDARRLAQEGDAKSGILLAFQDITERKQAEEKLRDSERRFREMIDALPVAIYTTDAQGQLTHFNPAAVEFSGRVPQLGIDHWCITWKLYHPNGTPMPHDECPMAIALKEGSVRRGAELITERPDGKRIWFTPYPTLLRNSEGKIVGGINILLDITERRQAETRIAADLEAITLLHQVGSHCVKPGEDYDKCLSQLLDTAIALTRADKGNIQLLDAATGTLKIAAQQGFAEPFLRFFASVRAEEASACGMAMRSVERVSLEDVTQSAILAGQPALDVLIDAGVRAVQSTPLVSSAGRLLGMISTHFAVPRRLVERELRLMDLLARQTADYLERKQAEEAKARLAAIVESSDDAIISKDLNGIVTSWNRSAERLFGYRAEEIIGQPVTVLMPAESSDEVKILDHIRRGVAIEHYETIRRRKDGRPIEVSLSISPIRDSGGRIIGASKIVRDITQQKQAERRLERAHKEAVAASHAKDEFLAALSHELRTPLNPVLLLASEAAEDSTLTTDVRAQFATIRNNVELEARLIDDLLDITRITHGKLSINLDEVDVADALRGAIETVRADLNQKHLKIVETFQAKQTMIRGDGVRLRQVFWNVLKNAVKFTPVGGEIKVSTRTLAGKLIVTISDTGIGMTETELAQIFEAFTQGDHVNSGGSHRFGGLGLGLAISRKLMELHAGTIKASSQGRDMGATLTLTLPLTVASKRQNHQGSVDGPSLAVNLESPAREIRVLLVEDHEATRTTLAHLLTRRCYYVKTAASVAEARELALTGRFQLLISDIGLPDGTGFELMSELKAANEGLQGIALTGYGMEDDIAKGLEAGFKMHLTKPVRVQSLEAALATVIAELDA